MNLRKLLLASTAVAMLASIFASSASAAAVTEESHWTVEGVNLAAGAAKNVKCEVGKHTVSETKTEAILTMTGTIGEGAGVPTEITATGIECINHEGEPGANGTAKIEQVGASAQDFGRLRFTGVKVVKPENCTVASTLITNPLKSEIYMHEVGGGKVNRVFDRFEPTGANFITIVIGSKAPFTCAIAGNRIVKGFVYGQSVEGEHPNVFEKQTTEPLTETVVQSLLFSKAIDETAGSALTFGGNPAHLTGRVENQLTTGQKWGAMK
jgi:hypothetical protein